jgi:ribosomal-protein-alanine N-acetyltransferase
VEKGWGYFSKKDGERHSFDLCEHCYDKIIETFALPVEAAEATELL